MTNKAFIKEKISKATGLELELVWIPKIMQNQTADEVQAQDTIECNGKGLNGRDAPFISDLATRIATSGHLTPNQAQAVRRILPKYAGQYVSMSRC